MKKISSLLLALCVFCSAFAEVTPLDVAELVAPAGATLQKLVPASHEKSAKVALEKKAAQKAHVAKTGKKKLAFAPAAASATAETITISGNLQLTKFDGEFYYEITTDDYYVALDIYSETLAGTFTETDLFSWYSGVMDYATDDTYNITTASITVTGDAATGIDLSATLVCSDGNTYKVIGHKSGLPTPKDTVVLSFGIDKAAFYDGKSVAQFYARDLFPAVSADSIYATIAFSRSQEDITGEYNDNSVYTMGCYVAYFGTDTTIVDYLEDQISVVITETDGKYTCKAELLGVDTIYYQLSFVTAVPEPVKPKKYVDIVAHNLEVTDLTGFFGLAMFEASNDDYEVYFGVYSDTLYVRSVPTTSLTIPILSTVRIRSLF